MITIAFTGGGTGGHIYPGLAVAARLKTLMDVSIVWIGSDAGMDRDIVERAGIPFVGVPAGKLRRYLSLRNAADVFKVLAGFFASRRALRRLKPALLFSKGGFVSVPPCAAAASLGIPVFTHESDYSPGLATRINLRFAERVFTAYGDTIRSLPPACRSKAAVAGNPVRAEFRTADPERGRRFLGLGPRERILLVLGGSQGARQVNELVAAALDRLCEEYVVVHQTGREAEGIPAPSERYRPYEYIRDELPDVLAAAELVVGRSGAGTVWEAAVAGLPMVLIPLAGSGTRGDQVENAEHFRLSGAAEVLIGENARHDILAEAVSRIARDGALRASMAEAARRLGAADGAAIIARAIVERLKGGKP